MTQTQIERTMLRIGVDNDGNICFRVMESSLPEEVNAALSMAHEGIAPLNQMCESISKLDPADQAKLGAVVKLAQPEYASQIKILAENLDLFDFIPAIQTPEEYGRYMIRESGHFEYDDTGLFGTVTKTLVFSCCLYICDETSWYCTKGDKFQLMN